MGNSSTRAGAWISLTGGPWMFVKRRTKFQRTREHNSFHQQLHCVNAALPWDTWEAKWFLLAWPRFLFSISRHWPPPPHRCCCSVKVNGTFSSIISNGQRTKTGSQKNGRRIHNRKTSGKQQQKEWKEDFLLLCYNSRVVTAPSHVLYFLNTLASTATIRRSAVTTATVKKLSPNYFAWNWSVLLSSRDDDQDQPTDRRCCSHC